MNTQVKYHTCGLLPGRKHLKHIQRSRQQQSMARLSQICCAHKIVVLPGDGIGPEIAKVAQDVLQAAGKACGEDFEFQEELIGGAAM
jgi:isocitrate dehydrogenase